MKKSLLHIVAITIMGFCLSSTSALAGDLFYAGADVGSGYLDSSSSTAYGLYAGTDILPLLGVEAGYWNFGSIKQTDYSSFYVAVRPSFTLASFQFYAKAGLDMYAKDPKYGKSKDGVDLMYGLGVDYYMTEMVSLGAAYSNFRFDGDGLDVFSVSFKLHFL